MDYLSLNTLRAILVGLAAVAFVILLVFRQFLAATFLGVGITFHGLLWVHLWRRARAANERDPLR